MKRLTKLGAVANSFKAGASSVAKNIVFGAPELDVDDGGAEPLLDRLINGALSVDRIAAAGSLRDLVGTNDLARAFVASVGVRKMFETLRDTSDDDALVRATLEALHASAGRTAAAATPLERAIRRGVAPDERAVRRARGGTR